MVFLSFTGSLLKTWTCSKGTEKFLFHSFYSQMRSRVNTWLAYNSHSLSRASFPWFFFFHHRDFFFQLLVPDRRHAGQHPLRLLPVWSSVSFTVHSIVAFDYYETYTKNRQIKGKSMEGFLWFFLLLYSFKIWFLSLTFFYTYIYFKWYIKA